MAIDPRAFSAEKLTPPAPLPYVSRQALKRVKNPLPAPTECRYCDGHVSLVRNSAVYGREFGGWPFVYLCGDCGAYVGLHPDTDLPLGTLADEPTRSARKSCKAWFVGLQRRMGWDRNKAYAWLAEQLGIDIDQCHFGWFEADQCLRAAQICAAAKAVHNV